MLQSSPKPQEVVVPSLCPVCRWGNPSHRADRRSGEDAPIESAYRGSSFSPLAFPLQGTGPPSYQGRFEHSRFRRGQEERRLRSLGPWPCHLDSTLLSSSMMVCKQLGSPSCKWVCCFPPPSRRSTSVKHLLWGKVCDNPAGCTCVPGIALSLRCGIVSCSLHGVAPCFEE